jgi:VIT1/CCC1 family predicted Fe2+/Mn2+ transporter
MEIDEKKIDNLFGSIKSAMAKISSMDLWLPEVIHERPAILLGSEDIEKMGKERREREKYDAEIESLHVQMEEAQKQTIHLRRQTKYLLWGVVFTGVTSLIGILLQISPNLFGLLGEQYFIKIIGL